MPSPSDTLTTPGVVRINGDDDPAHPDDNIVLTRDTSNPLLLDIYLDSTTPTQTVPVQAVSQIFVNGGAGSDTLTLDFRNGVFSPPAGIIFDGGGGSKSGPGDTLVIIAQDNTSSVETYNPVNGGTGTLPIDGTTVDFQNLTPVLASNAAEFSLTTAHSGNILALDSPVCRASSGFRNQRRQQLRERHDRYDRARDHQHGNQRRRTAPAI